VFPLNSRTPQPTSRDAPSQAPEALQVQNRMPCLRPSSPAALWFPRGQGGRRRAPLRGHVYLEPAGGRSEAGEKREKNGTSGVHGGGYFAPHDTNNSFFDFGFDFYFRFLFTYAVLEHLRTAHHLPDGRFASRGALVELFLFIPRQHSL
jgi:hypothetical protein